MKLLLVILAVICHVKGDDVRAAFQKAMAKYAAKDGLQLSESPEISKKRFKSFVKFHAMVEEINNDDTLPYKAADNFMSILTEEERNRHLGLNITGNLGDISDTVHVETRWNTDLPIERDFSLVISDVKDQGTCGSCWTYSATAALEGEIYFKTGTKHVSLSEQEYMDCVTPNDGCRGGWPSDCYTYSRRTDRVAPTSAYKYKGKDSKECLVTSKTANALVDNNVIVAGNINVQGDTALLNAASVRILSVAIVANTHFQGYYNGLYVDSTCNTNGLNHAVTVVGYGEMDSKKYWKVRNSWGADWGENGYIFMDRGIKDMCRISTYAHYPKVKCRNGSCTAPNPDDGDSSGDEEEEEEESVCFEKLFLSTCQKTRSKAIELCNSSTLSNDKCVIVKPGKKCFLATTDAVEGSKFVESAVSCKDEENKEECNTAGGMVLCSDCNCCKHKHFCKDTRF